MREDAKPGFSPAGIIELQHIVTYKGKPLTKKIVASNRIEVTIPNDTTSGNFELDHKGKVVFNPTPLNVGP